MEANDQLQEAGCERPTHVFIQAGVGSLAGAVQGYFANRYPENPPKVVVVKLKRLLPAFTKAQLPVTEHPHRRRRYGHHYGWSCLRRTEHHFMGYLKESCGYLYRNS